MQYIAQLVVVELLETDAVILKQIDKISPQSFEGSFHLRGRIGGGAGVGAIHVAMEFVSEFRRDDPLGTIASDSVADQRFGGVIAVAFGRVDEIDVCLAGGIEHPIDFVLGEIFSPFAAQLPGPQADYGDAKIGFSKPAEFHDR